MIQYNNQSCKKILLFNDKAKKVRAFTTKVSQMESIQQNSQYKYGNNEEWITLGQQLLEFLFIDYMTIQGYPNQQSQYKKTNDLIQLRQKLLNDKNLYDISIQLKLDQYLQVGKQQTLKTNPKTLSECLKALIAAQYMDKEYDIDQLREIVVPIIKIILDKNQHLDIQNDKNNANPKSLFYEFLQQIEWKQKPKVTHEFWQKKIEDTLVSQHKFTLELGNQLQVNAEGESKRETEQNLYQQALNKLKNSPNFPISNVVHRIGQLNINYNGEQQGSEFIKSEQLSNTEKMISYQSGITQQNNNCDDFTQQFIDKVLYEK